jgi:hypothetical protein
MSASPQAVAAILAECQQAAAANRACRARRGNVVCLSPEQASEVMIVADLHGNRLNFEKLLRIADLDNFPHLVMQSLSWRPEYPGKGRLHVAPVVGPHPPENRIP